MSSAQHHTSEYHQIAQHPSSGHHHQYHKYHHHHHHHWEDMTVFLRWLLVALSLVPVSMASRLPLVMLAHHHHHHHHQHPMDLDLDLLDPERWDSDHHLGAPPGHQAVHQGHQAHQRVRVLYQVGNSEAELPECAEGAVCSKLDVYEKPWLERQCRCPGQQACPAHLSPNDGHTIVDKTRQLKMCDPVKKLPKCRYFRDVTWTLVSGAYPGNATQQVVHCHCPRGSVAYLVKRQAYTEDLDGSPRYKYSFACSPQSRLRCQRKEPCRLFTVRRRQDLLDGALDEVNTNSLCGCPHNHYCPTHHSDPGVIQGNTYQDDSVRTYSGYCLPL